jgi:hypothetical protein
MLAYKGRWIKASEWVQLDDVLRAELLPGPFGIRKLLIHSKRDPGRPIEYSGPVLDKIKDAIDKHGRGR